MYDFSKSEKKELLILPEMGKESAKTSEKR